MRRTILALLLIAASACGRGTEETPAASCTGADAVLVRDGHLTVAADLASPPYAFTQDGTPTGFEIELVRQVAKKLSLEARVVDQTFAGLYTGLLGRRFDVAASALRPTPDARAQVCFTEPVVGGRIGVVSGTAAVDGLDALEEHVVAAPARTVAGTWARRELGAVAQEVRLVPTIDDVFLELTSGAAPVVVADLPLALYKSKGVRTWTVIEEVEVGEPFAWAVHPENKALLDALNEGLGKVRDDGTYAKLYEHWFGRPPPDD